ncbi:MAG: hypothetical protein GY752_00490 [bacterium]|nr:hypothetical protein [bacterium]MCP4800596.1 hypothetical protein [bacterium]
MTTTKKRPSSFYKMVFSGPHDLVHGFLSGIMLGSGNHGILWYCLEEEITGPSTARKLLDKVRVHGDDCHLIVDGSTRTLLKRNAKKMFAETGLQIEADNKISSARFSYTFHAFAKQYGDEILSTLKTMPRGVKKINTVTEENIHPEAKGVEAYAPAHHYEISGCGDLTGRIDLIIDARNELDQYPLVKTTWIELELA